MENKDIAQEVIRWLGSVVNFVAEQAPLLAGDVLRWGIAQSLLDSMIASLILYLGYRIWMSGTKSTDEDFQVWLHGAAIVFYFAAFIAFLCSLSTLVEVLVAPRLYLLEQLRRLL